MESKARRVNNCLVHVVFLSKKLFQKDGLFFSEAAANRTKANGQWMLQTVKVTEPGMKIYMDKQQLISGISTHFQESIHWVNAVTLAS